jgi:hypothetical protein
MDTNNEIEEVTLEQAQSEDAAANGDAIDKTVIRPKTENYVKSATGLHKDDLIGNSLDGLLLDQVKSIAAELDIDVNKYDHLNAGHQRMNIGNRLRKVVVGNDINSEHLVAASAAFKEANAAEHATENAVKAEQKAAKEAEKVAKAKAKAAKEAAKSADTTAVEVEVS